MKKRKLSEVDYLSQCSKNILYTISLNLSFNEVKALRFLNKDFHKKINAIIWDLINNNMIKLNEWKFGKFIFTSENKIKTNYDFKTEFKYIFYPANKIKEITDLNLFLRCCIYNNIRPVLNLVKMTDELYERHKNIIDNKIDVLDIISPNTPLPLVMKIINNNKNNYINMLAFVYSRKSDDVFNIYKTLDKFHGDKIIEKKRIIEKIYLHKTIGNYLDKRKNFTRSIKLSENYVDIDDIILYGLKQSNSEIIIKLFETKICYYYFLKKAEISRENLFALIIYFSNKKKCKDNIETCIILIKKCDVQLLIQLLKLNIKWVKKYILYELGYTDKEIPSYLIVSIYISIIDLKNLTRENAKKYIRLTSSRKKLK